MFDRRLWSEAQASRASLLLAILLSGLGGLAIVFQALFLSRTIDAVFLQHQSLDQVWPLLWSLLAVIVARSGLIWLADAAAAQTAATIKDSLRQRLYTHLLALGPAYAHGQRVGELTTTLVDGVDSLDAYFSQYLPQLAIAALVPVTILLVIFPVDLLTAVILLLTAPLIPLFMVLIGRAAESLAQRQWQTLSQMGAHFLDVLQGLRTLKELGQSRPQIDNVARISHGFGQATLRVLRVAFLSAFILELVATLSVAIVAVQIGLRLLGGRLLFADALFILVLAPDYYQPLRQLAFRYHAGVAGKAAAQRIFAILDTPLPAAPELRHVPAHPGPLPAEICLEKVSYAYDQGRRPALREVSFCLQPGLRLALVGASGAGKSTVASLLLGFVRPDAGQITAGGRPLAEIDLDSWRSQVAWVPQMPYLFHDTIAANIALGRPGASLDEIAAAARLALLDDEIRALPAGYQTRLGERGLGMSGGQLQRLALARAFLKDAPLLILDEPTSELDPDNESRLVISTRRLMEARTVLVIAHRLQTVAEADEIILLDQGRIVERGSHEELAARDGPYRRLIRLSPAVPAGGSA
jgi:ATP-binding cassette, subfamily C, bacterial CydD